MSDRSEAYDRFAEEHEKSLQGNCVHGWSLNCCGCCLGDLEDLPLTGMAEISNKGLVARKGVNTRMARGFAVYERAREDALRDLRQEGWIA